MLAGVFFSKSVLFLQNNSEKDKVVKMRQNDQFSNCDQLNRGNG